LGITNKMAYGKRSYKKRFSRDRTKRSKFSSKKKKTSYRRKRRSSGRRNNSISLGFNKGAFMPATSLCNHVYSDVITLGTGTGINHYYMSLNNMFDPDPATGGHQPLGHDQMAGLYGEYVVIGATWKATFYGTSNSTQQVHSSQKCFGLIGRTDDDGAQETPAGLSATEFVERGWKSKGSIRHVYAGKPLVLTGKWNAKRHFSKMYTGSGYQSMIKAGALGAVVGAGPQQQAHLCLGTYSDDSTAAQAVQVRFEISYQCLWHEPNDVGQS